jgi:hypothetical protein
MINQSVVDLIYQGLLSGLPHPGNPDDGSQPHAIILPVFNTVGQPPEIVEKTEGMAKSLAEAIAFLIQEKGMSVVDTAELDSLRTSYDPAKGQRIVSAHCSCGTALLMLSVTDAPRVTIDGRSMLSGFRTKNIDCPHGEVS